MSDTAAHRRTSVGTATLLALSLLAAGCALHRVAGTGDVAFRLAWSGISDLDLLVLDPGGACIFFGDRVSDSGGTLDVDCNSGADRQCARPVENVFWPAGTAPAGNYYFWAHAHSLVPAEAPLGFQLQVLRGERIVWIHRGEVTRHEELVGPFRWSYPSGRIEGPLAGEEAARHVCVQRRYGVITLPPSGKRR